MAYNNYFPVGYQPYIQPQPQPQQPNTDMKWVQGEMAAKSYPVAPNTSVTLWDQESQTIYIKSADVTGMQSIKVLDYTMRDTSPQNRLTRPESDFATKADINSVRAEIEALRANLSLSDGKENEE